MSMGRRSVNSILLVALLALVGMTWYVRRDYRERNSDFLPGMVRPVPYEPQEANPNFADGKTLRVPEPGTVARGLRPLHYAKTPEDAVLAGEELLNPVPDSSLADRERGGRVFATFCQPCHGPGGLGDGTVPKRGFPAPPSLLAERARRLKDGQIFHIITYGQNNMPSLASQVSRTDRWRAARHVRALQKAAPMPPQAGGGGTKQ